MFGIKYCETNAQCINNKNGKLYLHNSLITKKRGKKQYTFFKKYPGN